ncbi:hypothetical protein [Sinomonas cyclohexanicum]|uniref:hypothetical protein n=1 Tax=Sinomonas cyclohexanicum TaxID=322009 RepID=UPI001E637837|nr:hypothetical protein [Corynebacterium cyclohexanicum]
MNDVAEICGTVPPDPVEVEVDDGLEVLQPASAATVRVATTAASTLRAETFMCFNIFFHIVGRC